MNQKGTEETSSPTAQESGTLPLAHAVWVRYGELSPLARGGGPVERVLRMERQAAEGASLSMEIIGRWGKRGELAAAGQGGLPYLRGVSPMKGGSAPAPGTTSPAEPARMGLPRLFPVSGKSGPASASSPGGAPEAGHPGSAAGGSRPQRQNSDGVHRVSPGDPARGTPAGSMPVAGSELPVTVHGVSTRPCGTLSPEAGRGSGQPAHTAMPLKGLTAGNLGVSPKVAMGAVADRPSPAMVGAVLRRIPAGGKDPHAVGTPAAWGKVTVTPLSAASEPSSRVIHGAPRGAANPVPDHLACVPAAARVDLPRDGAPDRPAEPWYRSKAGTQPYLIRKLSVTVQNRPDSSRPVTPPMGASGEGVPLRPAGPGVSWQANGGHGDITLSTTMHRGRSVAPAPPPAAAPVVSLAPRRAAMALVHRHDPPRESAPISPERGAAAAPPASPVAPVLPLVRRGAASAPASGQAGSAPVAAAGPNRMGAGPAPGATPPGGRGGAADRAPLPPGAAGAGTGGEPGPPAGTSLAGSELERLADRVYSIIEQRLTIEKESRGL